MAMGLCTAAGRLTDMLQRELWGGESGVLRCLGRACQVVYAGVGSVWAAAGGGICAV